MKASSIVGGICFTLGFLGIISVDDTCEDNYNPKTIVSFSDRARTSGNIYSELGFKLMSRTEPGYMWIDTVDDRAYSRINAQKQNIKKFLQDDTIDLQQSESQIMTSHGFVKMFDAGNSVWLWT